MELHLVQTLSILFLAFVASYAAVDPEAYFKSMLPNTPIPKPIKDSLANAGRHGVGKPKANFPYYEDAATDDQLKGMKFVAGKAKANYEEDTAATDEQIMGMRTASLFITEKEMRAGKSINLHISKDTTTTPPQFVPREIADSLPVVSNKLQDIYKAFNVKAESLEGRLVKTTVVKCEKASNEGQDESCVTSLESMVDFATSKLGKRIKAVSTQVDGKESRALHEYKVREVRKLKGDSVVVCHQEYYGYAVHVCHKTPKVNAYVVSLVGENDVKARAISVCHEDTSSWNPKHLAFQVLNLEPGKDAVCHFLVEDGIVWVPY